DDQADSTAQFLDWFKTPMPGWAFYELTRQRVQELEQRRKPPPVKTVFAPGSMEWLAEQEKARSAAAPDPGPHTPPDVDSLGVAWARHGGDLDFESTFLQQAVCLSREPRGRKRKAPQFGGGPRSAGDAM